MIARLLWINRLFWDFKNPAITQIPVPSSFKHSWGIISWLEKKQRQLCSDNLLLVKIRRAGIRHKGAMDSGRQKTISTTSKVKLATALKVKGKVLFLPVKITVQIFFSNKEREKQSVKNHCFPSCTVMSLCCAGWNLQETLLFQLTPLWQPPSGMQCRHNDWNEACFLTLLFP